MGLKVKGKAGMRWTGGGGGSGGCAGGCTGDCWRLEERVGGDVWRVQTYWRAVGGGQKRLARLIVTPTGEGAPTASLGETSYLGPVIFTADPTGRKYLGL